MNKKLLRKKLALMLANLKKKRPFYTELEYIESTGTQYIDTGIKPIISDTVKPVIKLVHQFNTLDTCRIFGATDNSKYFQFFNNATGSDGFGIQLFNTGGNYTKFTLDTDKHVYEISTASSIAKQDDTKQSLSFSHGSLDYNIYLFARNTKDSANNYMKGKIFYFEYDDGVQHRQFIPVLDWNMKPCMFDRVTEQLFYNAGTGDFIAGREIHPVEYLESTGTQYIDTKFKPNNNTHLQIYFQLTDTSTPFIFDAKNSWSFKSYTAGYWPGGSVALAYGSSGARPPRNQVIWTLDKILIDFDKRDVSVGNLFSTTFNSETFVCDNPLLIFKGVNETNYAKMKLYYCKIWDDGTLTRDYIPAVDENDTFFMFDRVSHTCYNNAGSGSFIGPTVAKDEQGKIVEPEYE